MDKKYTQPIYDISKSWDYNYDHGPFFQGSYPPLPKEKSWKFLGHSVISPLGVAAGPMPNAKWLKLYSKFGFGSLVQKTVRSSAHKSHPAPNVLYLDVKGKLTLDNKPVVGKKELSVPYEKLTITNSFGNPCRDPKIWMRETQRAKKALAPGQILGVSVYGTTEENTTLEELAEDYAKTAGLAKKAGAMFIEVNLACPNVKGTEDPFIYKNAKAVATIVKTIKARVGNTPIVLKIGYFENYRQMLEVLKSAKGAFNAISAINTISKKIVDKNGKQALPGRDTSGVCGFAIKKFGITMVRNLVKAKKQLGMNFEIIGVGGVMVPKDVADYLEAGANHVHSATAVLWNPYLAQELDEYLTKRN